MAYRVEVSRRAQRDFITIFDTINAEQSPASARWFVGLEDAVMGLAAAPRSGSPTHENPVLRHLIHGNKPHFYRIIYKINDADQVVTIMQIRHGRRQAFR
jgi:toxin ParE1/3/4